MIYHTTSVGDLCPRAFGSFADLAAAVGAATETIAPNVDDFDFIAVQGVSGMSLGFPLALALDKPIVVIRKECEIQNQNSHSHRLICGDDEDLIVPNGRGLFVDDFISMGDTRRRVASAIEVLGGRLAAEYTARENDYLRM